MITNCRKNEMGTVSFNGKFTKMLKPQDFIVYPLKEGTVINVQSDTRFGQINLFNGMVKMSQPHASGAYSIHLEKDTPVFSVLAKEDCEALRGHVKASGGELVGGNVKCDNSGAMLI